MPKWSVDLKFLEYGDIYFFYKPKRNIENVKGINDVARFFIVLQPYNKEFSRYIVMGGKKMPGVRDGGESTWGFIQMVGGRGFGTTKSSVKPKKGASRPSGEGIYAVVKHKDHTHLLYSLELPKIMGEVQKSFGIEKEGDYVFLNRPIESSPKDFDIPYSNFSPVKINNLNRRGTEILLIGVGTDIGRLGIRAETDVETIETADVFSRLKVNASRHPIKPLITGNWI